MGSRCRLRRLLIANRGEIALAHRARGARAWASRSVLAASAADRDSLAAREADRAVVIGPAPARASYLDARLIVHAAKATGCDALHPGYGFLSERAALARLCEEEGIVFVGPTAESIERGRRQAGGASARARPPASPMVAGQRQAGPRRRTPSPFADEIGYPVVTKASAGGGGRGMVVARDAKTLAAGVRARLERSEGGFRRRHALSRALRRARAPRRSAGDGRRRRAAFCISASATARCSAATRK